VGKAFPLILDELEAMYGRPEPPYVTDPFEMILWENVIYLSDDLKRRKAFDELRDTIGTRPEDIPAASWSGNLQNFGSQVRSMRINIAMSLLQQIFIGLHTVKLSRQTS
jgi:hypothetical protein